MPKHAAKGDELAPALVKALADDVVVGVVCRGDEVQRMVGLGLLYAQLQDVKSVVYGKVGVEVRGVEGVELRLRVA